MGSGWGLRVGIQIPATLATFDAALSNQQKYPARLKERFK